MKKKLPVIRWKAAEISQTERLQRWIKEREMVLLLEQESGTQEPGTRSEPGSPGSLSDLIADFDTDSPQPGEIRLLSSALLPGANRPVYVLVLADWESDLKLIAPFGPMTEPATPGELLTQRDETAIAVLCLWNTHSVPASHLAKSWIVDRISESELADAWMVFRHTATGAPVGAALETRIGMPILDENDPRIAYQADEAALLSPLIPVENTREESPAPPFPEWVKFSLASFFDDCPLLRVAGSVDIPTAFNEYIIKIPTGDAKLEVFAERERVGNNARVVFRLRSHEEHWPLHIVWERRTPTGELIGQPAILAFAESQQKIERRLNLQIDDELWAFAYKPNSTPIP